MLPLWPEEIGDRSQEGNLRILRLLRRALREERRRGLAGDWAYDLSRHQSLYRALKAEIASSPPPLTSWAAAPFRRERREEEARARHSTRMGPGAGPAQA